MALFAKFSLAALFAVIESELVDCLINSGPMSQIDSSRYSILCAANLSLLRQVGNFD